ncbi:MAG: hypothetical protein AB7K09_02965 [Planctomycetota bacterium]
MQSPPPVPLAIDRPAWFGPAWVLRGSVALLALGIAASILPIFNTFSSTSKINSMLIEQCGVDDPTADAIDTAAACIMLLIAVATLATRRSWPLLPLISLWLLVELLYRALVDEVWHPELLPAESALRLLAPLALMLWLARPRGTPLAIPARRAQAVEWLLRIAIAATFAGHGMEALLARGHFVDLILAATQHVPALQIGESHARALLPLIGGVDLAVAVLILVPRRWTWLVVWLTLWGLLTAASRIIFWDGLSRFDDTLTRMVHGGAPLALLVWWRVSRQPGTSRSAAPAASPPGPVPPAS